MLTPKLYIGADPDGSHERLQPPPSGPTFVHRSVDVHVLTVENRSTTTVGQNIDMALAMVEFQQSTISVITRCSPADSPQLLVVVLFFDLNFPPFLVPTPPGSDGGT